MHSQIYRMPNDERKSCWTIFIAVFELKAFRGQLKLPTYNKTPAAVPKTARVTIRSVIAVGRLTLSVTLCMTYVNFIPLTELSICGLFCNQLCRVS